MYAKHFKEFLNTSNNNYFPFLQAQSQIRSLMRDLQVIQRDRQAHPWVAKQSPKLQACVFLFAGSREKDHLQTQIKMQIHVNTRFNISFKTFVKKRSWKDFFLQNVHAFYEAQISWTVFAKVICKGDKKNMWCTKCPRKKLEPTPYPVPVHVPKHAVKNTGSDHVPAYSVLTYKVQEPSLVPTHVAPTWDQSCILHWK